MAKSSEPKFNSIGSASAIINKVQTTVDGGARITLDLSSQDHQIIKALIDCYLMGSKALEVGFVSIQSADWR
jgi:hypothetical protein